MKQTGNQGGFSIIEVLIGVAIFMVGMLGVAALLVSSVSGDAFSGNLTEATTLAASRMDILMGQPPAALVDDGDGTNQDANGDGIDDDGGNFGLDDACVAGVDPGCVAGTTAPDGCDGCTPPAYGIGKNNLYRVFWNVSPNNPGAGLISIKVIVSWRVKEGRRSISISGIRSGVI